MGLRYAGLHVPRIALAFVVALAVLMGAYEVWQLERVDRPLLSAVRSVPGVGGARLEESADGEVLIAVELKPVEDLRATYLDIEEAAHRVLGGRPFAVSVAGTVGPTLAEDFRLVRLAVAEGVETGRYTAMAEKVAEIAAQAGAQGRVDVDGRFVFVQVVRGGQAAYEVVPRRPVVPGGTKGGGAT